MALQSAEPVPLYRILLAGDNSFAVQSLENPHGWGLSYIDAAGPVVVKSILPAICDELFEQLSFSVRSCTVLGHIRQATAGVISEKNCHPFQCGSWVFAHNGHIQEFPEIREQLLAHMLPPFVDDIAGDTDSEVFFRLFLSRYSEIADVNDEPDASVAAEAMGRTVKLIRELSAESALATGNKEPSLLTCLLHNRDFLMGVCFGMPLAFRAVGEGESAQVLFSSEEIATAGLVGNKSIWSNLADGEYAAVRADLIVQRGTIFSD